MPSHPDRVRQNACSHAHATYVIGDVMHCPECEKTWDAPDPAVGTGPFRTVMDEMMDAVKLGLLVTRKPAAVDEQTGIAIKYVQQYDVEADKRPTRHNGYPEIEAMNVLHDEQNNKILAALCEAYRHATASRRAVDGTVELIMLAVSTEGVSYAAVLMPQSEFRLSTASDLGQRYGEPMVATVRENHR